MLQISDFAIGPLETNCFVVDNGKEAIAVDPGGNPEKVLAYLKQKNLGLTHILLTHLHFDHTFGAAELARATGAVILASDEDRFMLDSEHGRGGIWGLPLVEPYEFVPVAEGEMTLLGEKCQVFATPGHTPGGLSFYFPSVGALFSGDALFYRSVGRSDFPRGDHETLVRSIREKLFTLPEDTKVYPGHGLLSSIGDERRNNPHVGDFR